MMVVPMTMPMVPVMMTSAMPMIAAMAVNADAERDLPGLHLSEKHAKRRLLMER